MLISSEWFSAFLFFSFSKKILISKNIVASLVLLFFFF